VQMVQREPAVTPGGALTIRDISSGDADRLRRMFSRLSPETIYRRFHSPFPRVPEWALALLAGVDHDKESLVAVVGEEIVGHAMYVRSENEAEIGIVVEDAWQRKGIGKLLLIRLALAARRRRIEAFTGVVLGQNRPMMLLLAAVFTGVKSTIRGGQYEIYAPLPGLETVRDPAPSIPTSRSKAQMNETAERKLMVTWEDSCSRSTT
jgi:GNAT superfamily N-acetyltransferase